MPQEWAVPENRFVVEVRDAVPGDAVAEVAAGISERFGMDPARVRKLLWQRTGPITKPVLQETAELIARVFAEAGVAVEVRPAPATHTRQQRVRTPPSRGRPADNDDAPGSEREPAVAAEGGPRQLRSDGWEATPGTLLLSSTRWVPSPHEEAAATPAVGDRAVIATPGAERLEEAGGLAVAARGRPSPVRPPARGLDLRGYLLVGFAASLLLLAALQAINGIAAGRAHPASIAAGLHAYSDGDFTLARRLWLPLAEVGNPRARYLLGYMAENGQGRPWSNRDAARWYRLAAEQGYPQAQLRLGQLYQRGMGVPRDTARAARLFRAAADEGYGPAQFQYALALFDGAGVPQDFRKALRWFEAAAHNGVVQAQPFVTFAGSPVRGGGSASAGAGEAGAGSSAPASSSPTSSSR